MTPLELDLRLRNKGVHNISSYRLSDDERSLLSFGLNFIPRPPPASDDDMYADVQDFARSVRIRKMATTMDTPDTDRCLRIPNPNFRPDAAGSHLEDYITVVQHRVTAQLGQFATASLPTSNGLPHGMNRALQRLRRNTDIVIKPADKNLGPVVMDTSWYRTEALRQLSDATTYRRLLSGAPPNHRKIFAKLRRILSCHDQLFVQYDNGHRVLTKLAKFMLQEERDPGRTLARFYMLPKLHKTPTVGRPIVSSTNYLTFHASRWLDSVLQPVMRSIPSFVQDSRSLLQTIERRVFPSHVVLLAADVSSLYPSIPIDDGLLALQETLRRQASPLSNPQLVCDVMSWVLRNNYFEFGDTTWHQVRGTAMGTPAAVAFANIYLGHLEHELTESCPCNPLLLKRFVDDAFGVFASRNDAATFIECYNSLRPTIKLTFDISDTVEFLDLVLYKGERFGDAGLLDVRLHQKHLNRYLYLPPFSFHPPHAKRAFIRGELQRYCRNCSSRKQYEAVKKLFIQRLQDRGYPQGIIHHAMSTCSYDDRHRLLFPTANARTARSAAPLVFKTRFTPRHDVMHLGACLTLTERVFADPASSEIFATGQPIVCYRRAANLGELLTRARFTQDVASHL